MKGLKYFIFVLICCFNINNFSQNKFIKFEHITVENGLSSNAITSIIQDKQGFLWFGTYDGLNRYNGYNFKIFRNDPQNHLTISSNLIQSIFEDSNGILWIGTYDKGLNRFDLDKNVFIHFIYEPNKPGSINTNNITTIYEDKNKTLWVGTAGGGLNKFNSKTQKFRHFLINPETLSISDNIISSIYEDSKNILWIGSHKGLYIFNRKDSSFTKVKNIRDIINQNTDRILDITEDMSGNLWIATNSGLNKFDRVASSFISFKYNSKNLSKISDDNTSKMCLDSDGLIWVGTWGTGFSIFNPTTGKYKQIFHIPGKRDSLSHNRVTKIFKDRSDIIWFATEGGGLNKFDKRKTVFENYYHEPLNKNSLSQNNIKRIYEDRKGILWIGTDGKGLNRFDRRKNKFKVFLNNPNDPLSISGNFIKSILEDRFGALWIGTMNGLNKYNKKTNRFINYRYMQDDKNSIPSDTVSDIIEDSDGVLWFSFEFGESGLARYDRDRNIFIQYKHNPDDLKSIGNTNIIDIFEDKKKTIWCGGQNGLNRFNRKDEIFTNYTFEPNNKSSISHNWVWTIFEDKKERLWIGTYGGGLNLFDKKSNSFIHYTDKNGLANNVIYGILDDEEGNLWMSTNRGISKFNPENKHFKNYDKSDGLQGNEFNTGSYFKDKDGRLYFGGTNGITAFYPEEVKNNPNIPSVVITSFKVLNEEFELPEQISKTKKINLNYNQNFISFEFATLDYSIPGKNEYVYKLDGVDDNWVKRNTGKRFADYTDLSPGTYLFTVKGSNNDDIWNTNGTSVEIHISPPFWETLWFTVLWILLIILVLLIILNFTYRHITLLKEKAQADRFAAIGKYASFLAHDIKSPLEGTYLIMNELKKMLPETDEKQEYIDDVIGGISQIRSIIKGSLDFSKVNNPKFKKFDVKKIIEDFSAEFKKSKDCIFELELNMATVFVDHSLMQRVFFNLFQNSYQAKKENCEISIKTEIIKNKVVIYVGDKGKGISEKSIKSIFEPFSSSKEDGSGIGLAFVSEAIKNHNGSIRVDSALGKGTAFTILLPVYNYYGV